MAFASEYIPLELDQLRREAAVLKADGWRFIQTHAVNTDDGVDLYYSFMDMRDHHVVNYRVEGVKKDTPVPSITDLFLAAFVFENEARELFGVDMRDIAIDFHGAMYAPAQAEPMTFITPEQKAAKEKAAKVAAAKAAKEKAAGEESEDTTASPRAFVLSEEKRAKLEEKLATMSPEKVAKVRAALAAREAAATAAPSPEAEPVKPASEKPAKAEKPAEAPVAPAEKSVDAVLEEKIAGLDETKAAKVRAAIAAKAARDAGVSVDSVSADMAAAPADQIADEQLAELLGNMDDAKAAKVRAALSRKGGN